MHIPSAYYSRIDDETCSAREVTASQVADTVTATSTIVLYGHILHLENSEPLWMAMDL